MKGLVQMNILNTAAEQIVNPSQAFFAQLDAVQKMALSGAGEADTSAGSLRFELERILRESPHGIRELSSPLSD